MNVEQRQKIERRIVKAVIKSAIDAGGSVSLYDGGEWTVKKSRDAKVLANAIMSVDEESLRIHNAAGESIGTVYLVYGNDGYDVICDHTDAPAMDAILASAFALADKLETQYA